MFSVFLCEKNDLVRFDIIELVQNCFVGSQLHISESLKVMAEDLRAHRDKPVVVVVSGT